MAKTQKKSTWTKVGAVLKKAEGKKGTFVVLGNEKAKDEKYRTTTEVTVKDASGKTLATTKNGFLTVSDPRSNPNLSDEDREKISDRLVGELYIVENND